jgi:hypothetical protein
MCLCAATTSGCSSKKYICIYTYTEKEREKERDVIGDERILFNSKTLT